MSQFVCCHPQLHDQLPDPHIWPGNVHFHLRIVDLAHQPIASNIWEVPKDADQGQCSISETYTRGYMSLQLTNSTKMLQCKINSSHHQLFFDNPLTTAPSLAHQLHHPQPHLLPLCSLQAHLPRVCPFQQRSSLMRSAAAFSSLQMVCGRDTQKPRMGLSRSFSSETCMEVERRYDSDLRLNYPCLLQLAARSTFTEEY